MQREWRVAEVRLKESAVYLERSWRERERLVDG